MKPKLTIITALYLFMLCQAVSSFSQNIWSADSSSGLHPANGMTSVEINKKIYLIAFWDTLQLQIFDPTTQIWNTPYTSGTFRGRIYSSSCVVNGKMYVIGGINIGSNQPDVFDPAINTWNIPFTGGMFLPRYGLSSCAVNGKIYAIGGMDTMNRPTNSVQVFDPNTNVWSSPMTRGTFSPRGYLTACVVDGKIFVIGGVDSTGGNVTNNPQILDPLTNIWSTPLTTGSFTQRGRLTSSVVDGKIYVMGGSYCGETCPSDVLEVFDPSTNQWSTPVTIGRMEARMGLASSAMNGKIYAIGGYTPHTALKVVQVLTLGTMAVNPHHYFDRKNENSFMKIYPNPTTSLLSIRNALENLVSISIFNTLGEKVLEIPNPNAAEFEIDLSKLPAGMYFARITLPNEVITRKIIKE